MSGRARDNPDIPAPGVAGRSPYWRSLEDRVHPVADAAASPDAPRPDGGPLLDRRAALKLIGGSVALASLAGCGAEPAEEIVPYVAMPEHVVPGTPRYYATALPFGGYGIGVLGETHSGRPTRVEGNPDHPLNGRSTSAFAQAAVLDLYDPGRSQAVLNRDAVSSYDLFVQALDRAEWGRGGGLRLLTGRITSPSLLAAIGRFLERHPDARWYVHEPVERSALQRGAELAFGEALEPVYRFDRARVVLSLDADFLSPEEPAHLRYAHGLAAARRVAGPNASPPARLYAVESTPGLAGAAADHRLPVRADRVELLARGLARRLGIDVAAGEASPREARWLDTVARDLRASRGGAPVIAGLTQPARVHALAHAINHRLGNAGETVRYVEPVAPEGAGTLADLAAEIEAGAVETLIVLDANPVHTAPADLGFGALMAQRVPLTIHWGPDRDETARRATWHVPAAHPLETWGDLCDPLGHVSLQQPLIRPLFGGRTALELMAVLEGDYTTSARALLRDHWRRRGLPGGDFETAWRRALRAGVVEGTAMPERRPTLQAGLAATLDGPAPTAGADTPLLQFRPDPAAWDGRFVHNGWLQELPRPLTKVAWANPALIAPAFARKLGVETGDVVRLSLGGRSVEAPVWVLPGQPDDAVTLTLGYGRKDPGRPGDGLGVDAYRLRTADAPWFAPRLEVAPTGEHVTLPSTQHHHAMEDRGLVRRADWDAFAHDPDFAHAREQPPHKSLYPEPHPDPAARPEVETPYRWGMVIDFDACIGCNACVAACQAENNIPIVGPDEVARGREMHWLRIDRYYAGPPDNPDTVFQPVPCMHCENAPCEYVCPVEATVHSSEGLNEMVYNRCIGTRYCSQNCPYKVRRFNWFDFTGPDADRAVPVALNNPDVTVRSRGVMEKCTYCVQRISRARIRAKREDRRIATDEVTTACQDACPTDAIVFGDIADGDSAVARHKADPRNYALLEGLNTRPRTTYLAAVRNPNPELSEPDDRG